MAKTREDYASEGARARAEGKPNINDPKSWQQVAFSEGWRAADIAKMEEAQDEEAVPKIDVVSEFANTAAGEESFLVEDVSRPASALVQYPLRKAMPPDATILHLGFLSRAIATCSDDRRRQRLQKSYLRVMTRWAKRIERAPGGLR